MGKRIRKKHQKRRWYTRLGAVGCSRIFMAEVVNGKLRIAALARLRFPRESETAPKRNEHTVIPVRFFHL